MDSYILYYTLIALVVAGVIGGLLGVLIGIVAKKFEVEKDPRIEDVTALLPGANCGGCGFAGCADLAKSLVAGRVKDPAKCPACPETSVAKIAEYLGLVKEPGVKKVAVIHCGGNNHMATQSVHYNGVADCKSAMIVMGGTKGCRYGCLGMASCAHACPFNAIEVKDGLAVVHPDLCVGCGKCVETCPRHLITLCSASAEVHIYCNSPEKGAEKRKVCKVGCIGCRKCLKVADEGQIDVKGSLAVINYENPPRADVVAKSACPVHCIGLAQDYQVIGKIPEKTKPEVENV